VLAAGMLPAQLFGGLLFALNSGARRCRAHRRWLMFGLGVCNAIAVLLPMALILQSQQRLRRAASCLWGCLGALAMATVPGRARQGRCCSACAMSTPSM
jgi:peptidoglycan/LPS O-acetylase OafA/YrhL